MDLNDRMVDHLRHVAALPDLADTRYELGREIGRGGMGVVYAARDRDLDREVALKVLECAAEGEPQLIARLEHPAIVPVYEAGRLPDGRAWYAMKLLSGARLDQYLAGGPTLAERLRLFGRIGEAVAYAHTRGVIHRDLKPQNIMVGPFGEVYVMDWGVAGVAGTLSYRPPERKLDPRSDIYALGALLSRALPESAPPALAAISAKAMQPDPAARYQEVAGMLADIERYQEGLAVQAWREPLWHRARRFAVRNAVLLWLLAAYAGVRFFLFFLRNL